MVAERNESILGLKRRLSENGFAPLLASDPKEVHRLAQRTGWQLIVLDMLWMRQDPLELLSGWRRGGVRTLVLALAGPRKMRQTVEALDLGADDVLTRPFEEEEFLARVRALVRRTKPLTTRLLRIHDLEIDRQSHTVRRGGRLIPLTPREFALLEVLAQQPGQVVSRSAIWRHLYAAEGESLSNVVDVYIRYLRNKI